MNKPALLIGGISLVLVAAAASNLRDADQHLPDDLDQLAILAVGEDRDSAQGAIAKLRAAGPAGLERLFKVDGLATYVLTRERTPPVFARWQQAMDQVAAQHEASTARLYWYTDLDQAIKAAVAEDKPILERRQVPQHRYELVANFLCLPGFDVGRVHARIVANIAARSTSKIGPRLDRALA